jgi:hypothetical protein
MTAEDKIKEAEYNLDKLKKCTIDQFQFELSNFLGSCYSILEHLLEDHNKKFGFNLEYGTSKIFRDKANKMRNTDAIKFINWYDEEKLKLRNEKSYGFLVARRNHSIHKNKVEPEKNITLEVGLTPIWKDVKTGEISTGDRMPRQHRWWFFNENTNEDAIIVCEKFLTHIKKIVDDSQR